MNCLARRQLQDDSWPNPICVSKYHPCSLAFGWLLSTIYIYIHIIISNNIYIYNSYIISLNIVPGWDLRRGHQPCVGCFNSMFSWGDVCQATNRIRASLFHSNPMAFYQGYQMSDRTRPSSCQSSWFSNKGGSCPQWKTNPRKKGGFSSRNFLTM